MDNLDDSENNAKISDSAYSNSCSNSQSRRSHSSKSTHSGSHSSGSSGYGGKPSTSASNSSTHLSQPPEKRSKEKDVKKKKQVLVDTLVVNAEVVTECVPPVQVPAEESAQEEIKDVVQTPSPSTALTEKGADNMDISSSERSSDKDERSCLTPLESPGKCIATRTSNLTSAEGFSCVISMDDGVVMYATASLTSTLGFPKEMWIGRSFIDFVHPRDRNTFASQITSGLAAPKNTNGMQEKVETSATSISTLVCRIRRYRSLSAGFGVKEKVVNFLPFLLKLTFKNISGEEGKSVYLIIQATPFFTAFKTSNEIITDAVPFVIRHAAVGNLEYLDPASVPYLGYMPQDIIETDALKLYHPDDLKYLNQIYEIIVKEGGVPRCKPYRMLAYNGDYVKVETEWSSFINPWSRKLEFVTGKHHVVEGPTNINVFQAPDSTKVTKQTEEEKKKTQILRETIIRIMNEVLTKPAEVAKQQMSKRCQDLASFMESLMEETPKTEDELRLEIHEPDYSYYERDSVLLGGISPHHEYTDSKSSTETPLSYNQLNYNENLQRYFDSHQPYEDCNAVTGENMFALNREKTKSSSCMSSTAQTSGCSGDMTNSSVSSGMVDGSTLATLKDSRAVRLTEALLTKHNSEMEKELVKNHRDARPSSKGERVKVSHEHRRKKKEHLARCNAAFQPTKAGNALSAIRDHTHGVKRASKQEESDAKHHCRSRRRQLTASTAATQPMTTITTSLAANQWPASHMNGMNTYFLGVGIPQQMSLMSPVPAMPGAFPMTYYQPVLPTNTNMSTQENANSTAQYQQPSVPCMMYGQPWSPFVYQTVNPTLNPTMSYPAQQNLMIHSMQYPNAVNPLGLASRNYEEACMQRIPMRVKSHSGINWREKKQADSHLFSKNNQSIGSATSTNVLNRESAANSSDSQCANRKSDLFSSDLRSTSNSFSLKSTDPKTTEASKTDDTKLNNSEEHIDRTDGESSYSSFYSSFFKTDSGSAEDSGDAKKALVKELITNATNVTKYYEQPKNLHHPKKVTKRKLEPPWLEQVCVTSELIYKYQIVTKNMEDVLKEDQKRMSELEQPSLVNEQLAQLYLDLQLEGVAARLTLEEGITSSSSSGEESTTNVSLGRKKRGYSKLVMIYEEDAPLPPRSDGPLAPSSPDAPSLS